MESVKPITMSRRLARKKWKEYVEASKIHGEKYFKDLKGLYYHLKEERKIIDIFEAFKFAGLNEKHEPKLAIALANAKTVEFEKKRNGSGLFNTDKYGDYKHEVFLPEKTFPDWIKAEKKNTYDNDFVNQKIKTKVPIIPADKISNYKHLNELYILWEVDDWQNVPIDPFLLKRINNNLFVILSSWNLTKLERALVGGR